MLARRLHADLNHDEVQHVADGIQDWHVNHYTATATKSLAQARDLTKAAAAIDTEFDLTEEWIDLLADRLPASGRALCGAVRNVYCGTVLAGKPLDRAAVEELGLRPHDVLSLLSTLQRDLTL